MYHPNPKEFSTPETARLVQHPSAAADAAWTVPPARGDRRKFQITADCHSCDPLALDQVQIAVIDTLKGHGKSSAGEVSRLSGEPLRAVIDAMRALATRGYLADVSPGADRRSADWRDLCFQVAAAAMASSAGQGPDAMAKVKAKHVRDMLPGRRFSDVKAALDAARIRGLLGEAQTKRPRGRPRKTVTGNLSDAGAPSSTASDSSPSGENQEKVRRARGTAPVSSWTRRRFRVLRDLLGEEGSAYQLPVLEMDAKKVVKEMEAEVAARDPQALTKATEKQLKLIAMLVEELSAEHVIAHPAPDGELSKSDANDFIGKWMPLRPATPKQVEYATSIGLALGLEVPSQDGRYMHAELSKFIFDNRSAFAERQQVAA